MGQNDPSNQSNQNYRPINLKQTTQPATFVQIQRQSTLPNQNLMKDTQHVNQPVLSVRVLKRDEFSIPVPSHIIIFYPARSRVLFFFNPDPDPGSRIIPFF